MNKTPDSATPLGRHLLAEFYDCTPNILNSIHRIEEAMTNAAIVCGATIVQKNFHLFSPYGVSGVVIISESHLAIHTWPEYAYAAVDLFTCGTACDPAAAYDYLREKLGATNAYYSELSRGLMNLETQKMVASPFRVEKQLSSTLSGAARPEVVRIETREARP